MYLNDDDFFLAFRSIVKKMHRMGDRALVRFGLNHSEMRLMLLLYTEEAGCSQEYLISKQVIDRTSVGRSLKKLESSGYIRRDTSEADRRAKQVYLEPRGMEIKPQLLEIKEQIEAKVLQSLSRNDYLTLTSLLQKIDNSLNIEMETMQ